MFLRRMIAERFSRTKYGLPGQWVKEVSLQEGMGEQCCVWKNVSGWAARRMMRMESCVDEIMKMRIPC